MSNLHTVLCILEAQPGKEKALESALRKAAELSRLESANLEYRLHQSIDNPQQFILYENWLSKEQHQQQFEKSYIKDLVNALENLLAKPYQAYFGQEIK